MLEPFLEFVPHIDPRAFVHPSAVVIGRVRIGALASIWPCVTLRGDDGPIEIGDRTSIQDGTVVHMTEGLSTTAIGSRVTVGHGAILHGCTIGDDCIIGMGSIVLDNATIEPGCIVGAGALIPPNKRVPADSVVVGNPMTVLRTCTAKDRAWIEHSWKAYVERAKQYGRQP
jgi:carbonic anhydrase/acetyltransferase-like protein (isoleucine patch superfamily)